MKYDGLLFGNGLSINLVTQLKPLIKSEKHYLLDINDFLKAFINNRLSMKDENRIFNLFYKTKSVINLKCFDEMKIALSKFYAYNDANIEYWLGADLFREGNCRYDFSLIKSVFPSLYNIWHEIMIDYLSYLNLNRSINNFEDSVMQIIDKNAHIFTTNFDRLFEGLKPQHIHGSFVKGYKHYDDLVFSFINKERFKFKCIWGWNGFGKLNCIQDIKMIRGHENYFDFSFFFDKDLYIKHLLIYGIGFQNSGFMKELSASMPKYRKPTIGGIIDEHILIRLKGMQTQGQLNKISFAYHSSNDLQHYKYLSNYFDLEQVDYISSSSLPFLI